MASSFEPLFAAPPAVRPAWLGQLNAGFTADPRLVAEQQSAENGDPALAQAYAEGEAAGRAAALLELGQNGARIETLSLSLKHLDSEMCERLAQRLAETVASLCEATLAPLALDREALQRRCRTAARLLEDGMANACLRLHPEDVELLAPELVRDWTIVRDPDLARGTVLFETPQGAVRDGPDEWCNALREALGLC